MRGTLSLLAIFYAAFRRPRSQQWAQRQRSWRAMFCKFWEQSEIHRALMRARFALFLMLVLGGCALVGHAIGVGTNSLMAFVMGSGIAGAFVSSRFFSRTRRLEMLAAVLQRFRIVMRHVDEAIQSTFRVAIATSDHARSVLVLAQHTARFAAAAVRAHVGTCALVLTPRIAAAPRFAAYIPAA